MKLTEQEKSVIKNELFLTVKNSETRSRIITTAYGFAHENGEDGDVEKMVSYLMDNQDKIDELFNSGKIIKQTLGAGIEDMYIWVGWKTPVKDILPSVNETDITDFNNGDQFGIYANTNTPGS